MKNFKKVIILIVIILLVALLTCLGYNLYKTMKINGLVKHLNTYEKTLKDAFVEKEITKDNETSKVKTYYKETSDGEKYLIETTSRGEREVKSFANGKSYNFMDKDGKISYYENDNVEASYEKIPTITSFDGDSFKQIFFNSFALKLSEVEVEGKAYYKLKSEKGIFGESNFANFDEMYIEKDTGLISRKVDWNGDIKYSYSFEEVDQNVFNVPKK